MPKMITTKVPSEHCKTIRTGLLMTGSLCLMMGAAKANLVLTEVDFATNTIEISNLSESVTSGAQLDWCVPFSYGDLEFFGFSFAPGEVRTYVISFNLQSTVGNDLWIYLDRTGGFGDETKVITGVVWGSSQQGAGRTNAVTNETNAWDINNDFVPTASVPAGHSLQLKSGSPSSATSASWEVAASNLGTYGEPEPPVELELGIKKGAAANELILFWPTSTPAGAVLKTSATMQEVTWPTEGSAPTVVGDNNEVTVTVSAAAAFYRLESP